MKKFDPLIHKLWIRHRFGNAFCSTNSFILNGYVDTASVVYKERFLKNQKLTQQFNELTNSAKAGGGERAIKRHTEVNKKIVVRERLKLLLDNENDFLEIGTLAGWNMDYGNIPAAGIVIGIGPVSGRLCIILANDATVKGGTIYPIGVKKQLRGQELAKMLRLPCIYVVDSGGAYLPLQSEIFLDGGRVFCNQAVMGSENIPQIAMVCGSCTAGAAYIPTMADNAIIVDRIGSVFLGGPPLVQAALGEVVTSEELGGATLHCKTSGCTDYFAKDEQTAFAMCREVVANLNTLVFSPTPQSAYSEPVFSPYEFKGLAGQTIASRNYIDCVLARILDGSKFFEFRPMYGDALVVGYGRIGGHLLGIVVAVGSPICYRSSQKSCQFVQMCSQQNVPVLFLHNTMHDGWTGYSNNGDNSALKNIASLMNAIACCESPKISLLIGNSFGSDYLALCGRSFDPTFIFAWPNSCLGIAKQGIKASQIDSFETEATINEEECSAIYAASYLWVDQVILPQDTRKVLKMSLDIINHPKNLNQQRDSSVLRF